MKFNRPPFFFLALGCGLSLFQAVGLYSQQSVSPAPPASSPAQEQDPLKRPRSDEETRKAQKAVRQELKGAYKTWLDQDVTYIISDEEREAFIEQFWLRRNPNPDSPDNEFREEHYRRIAYANEHFAAGKPGWKTDRGHIYIAFGKPDSIDSHPSGGSYQRPMDEGGGETSTFPFEVWHYRYLEGVGDNLDLEFVDTCQCGDYHFTIDRGEKDALQHVPGMGLTQWEQMGQAKKADRFKGGFENLGTGPLGQGQQSKQFDRIELAAKVFAPPPIKFKDLDNAISEHTILNGPIFPFDVRTDFIKVTENTVLVPITIQIKNRDVTFLTKDGVARGVVNILGKVTTLTHKTVQTFEDTVEVEQPAELLEKSLDRKSIYWKAVPLLPGLYRLDIAIKDVNNPDHIGIYGRGIDVPTYHDEKLATSSLILADQMSPVDSHSIGAGNCVIGNTKICPRVTPNPATPVNFKRNQDLNFWMQVYNLGIGDDKKNNATIEYQILDMATNKQILVTQETAAKLNPNADQLTLEKTMPLASLTPGRYQVLIKVNDGVSKQQIAESAPFNVVQ